MPIAKRMFSENFHLLPTSNKFSKEKTGFGKQESGNKLISFNQEQDVIAMNRSRAQGKGEHRTKYL